MTNHARWLSGSHSRTSGGNKNGCSRSAAKKFCAMPCIVLNRPDTIDSRQPMAHSAMMIAMDRIEAIDVAEARLSRLRKLTYSQLVAEWLDQPRSEYATAASGRSYNLEIEAVWDDRPDHNLRVWVLVDDGGP